MYVISVNPWRCISCETTIASTPIISIVKRKKMAVTPNPQSKILAAGCLPPLPKFPTVLPPYPSTHPNHSSITHIHLLVVSPFDSPSTLPKTTKGDLFECSSSNRSRPCHAGQVRPYCQQDPATVMLIASFSDLEKALRRNGHNW